MNKKRKLKIALICSPVFTCPPKNYGGSELMCYNLAWGLANLGHKVTLFAPKGSKAPPNVELVECFEPTGTPVGMFRNEMKMFLLYKDRLPEFDIIHSYDWFALNYVAKELNLKLKCTHTHNDFLNDWLLNNRFPFKQNMISISIWMKILYASKGIESHTVYNGINLDDYPFQKEKGDRFLFLGRLIPVKGPEAAIAVAKRAKVPLDIVGSTSWMADPIYIEKLKSQCDGKKIRFIGEVDHATKVKYLQNAKALLVTGKWGEPFGLHIIEAMACGTPVIAFKDGGIVETVLHGRTGYICDNDWQMMEAIKIIDSIDPRECRKRAKYFSKENMAKNCVKQYLRILKGMEW